MNDTNKTDTTVVDGYCITAATDKEVIMTSDLFHITRAERGGCCGALVMNTRRVPIFDYDYDHCGVKNDELSIRLHLALKKLNDNGNNGNGNNGNDNQIGYALYRTAGGFRVILLTEVDSFEEGMSMAPARELIDRRYLLFSKTSGLWRARLTPKYRRIGVDRTPLFGANDADRNAWLCDYYARCHSYSTAHRLDYREPTNANHNILSLIMTHDAYCNVWSFYHLA